MRRRTLTLAVLAAMAVACATTPQQRELQTAQAIKRVDLAATDAVNYGIIDADTADKIAATTEIAGKQLKDAVKSRREGQPMQVWEHFMGIIEGLLENANRLLDGLEE